MRSVKLWRLLDVAAADEPERSEQRANVGELELLKARQLGGVEVCAVSWTVGKVVVGAVSLRRKCLKHSQGRRCCRSVWLARK
jgi:hypothetical protein